MNTIASRFALAAFVLCFASACGTITPGHSPAFPRLGRPVLPAVHLVGLEVTDIRLAGVSHGLHTTSGTAYSTASSGGLSASATSNLAATHATTVHHMARVETDELREALRYALEDNGVVERFTPEARIRIEGRRIEGAASTGAGKVLWNIVNGVTLLSMIPGLPFLGDQQAVVELRVYEDDRLLRSYRASGDASWRKNLWGIGVVLNQVRMRTLNAATEVAARRAVLALLADPPPFSSGVR